jgi:hypothetical protein
MNLDDALTTTRLIDCQGRVTHTLTLLLDGQVRVVVGPNEALVEPRRRTVPPPQFRLGAGEYSHEQVVQLACDMAVGR